LLEAAAEGGPHAESLTEKDERQYDHVRRSVRARGIGEKRARRRRAHREQAAAPQGEPRGLHAGNGQPDPALEKRKRELYNRARQIGIGTAARSRRPSSSPRFARASPERPHGREQDARGGSAGIVRSATWSPWIEVAENEREVIAVVAQMLRAGPQRLRRPFVLAVSTRSEG
jgi:hypothetical protein